MRQWKALLAAAVALAAGLFYLQLPRIAGDGSPTYLQVLGDHIWYYRQEAGDYPRTASQLVEKVGPRLLAGGGLKLSLLHDNVALLEGPKRKIEVEYYYVSPDTSPTTLWKER